MARATISRTVDRVSVISTALGTSSQPALQVRDQNFPSGDLAIRSLMLRYDATITGTSTPTRVTNGHLFYLNALTVETDKHGKIVDSVDGLLMNIFNQLDFETPPDAGALSSTPADTDTPYASLIIPFSFFSGPRPYDTNMDMLKARMKVSTQYGPGTNLWTQGAGTPQVATLDQSIDAKVLPGPLRTEKDSSELPIYVRSFEQMQVPITATTNRYQIALPFGDRIWRRLVITQRNLSNKTEMTTVVGATAEISLYVNNIPIVDKRRFRDIQSENKQYYGLSSLPTGIAVLDFDFEHDDSLFNMLWTLTNDSGNMFLYIDVTSVSNGSLLLGFDCLKPIAPAAQRG